MEPVLWIIMLFFIFPAIFKAIIKKVDSKNAKRPIIKVGGNPLKNLLNSIFQNKFKFTNSTKNNMHKLSSNIGKIFFTLIVIIVIIIIFLNIVITIPAGHTGVRTLFGKVKDDELSSGIHIINPFEQIEEMSIRTEEYTMSIANGEGQRRGSDQISALTNEGLKLDLDITIFYKLEEHMASDVYRDLGLDFEEKIIRPEIRSAIRGIIAQYDAKAIYSEKRGEVASDIKDHLIKAVESRGIIIEQVLLRNVILPLGLAGSIQQKLQAEQDAQRLDFVLEKEKKEAERKRIEAQGQSDAQNILNKTITPKYLQYLYISELKDRQGTIYIPTGSDGLPIIKSIQ